jgi:hypothetical protein
MIDRRIGKIRIRRGTDLERRSIIFPEGELLYTTDNKRVYIGDGISSGGVVLSNRNYITQTLYPLPITALYGDIIYTSSEKKTYILDYNNKGLLVPVLIADALCCSNLRNQLSLLKGKKTQLSNCLEGKTPEPPTPPSNDTLTFVIQPINNTIELGDTATFTASAVGPANITYQWYKNGVIISGATDTKFEIMIVTLDDVANYKCVATSSIGFKDSNIASLIIGTAFIISDPSSEYIISDSDEFYISYE